MTKRSVSRKQKTSTKSTTLRGTTTRGKSSQDPSVRVLIFDIETTGFEANRGHILCAAAKWLDQEPVFTWRIDDTPGFGKTPASFHNDSAIVAPLVELLDSADAVVAYYGGYNKFDVPYVNTRALANGLKPANTLTVI